MANKKRRIVSRRKGIQERNKRYKKVRLLGKDWHYCRSAGGIIHYKACINRHYNFNKYDAWKSCEFCSRASYLVQEYKNKKPSNEVKRKIISRKKVKKIIRREP